MTTGRLGYHAAPPNRAYAGQVVQFPDPVRAQRYPQGIRVDADGFPDFSPYARAAAEIAEPPEGFGVDELRLTDYVSANAALHAEGHELWAGLEPVATPHGWVWHHCARSRRMELIPSEVKALLRHHGGLSTIGVDQNKRGTRPLAETRPVHFPVSQAMAVSEELVSQAEGKLGYRLPEAYRAFLKAAGGTAPQGVALDAELGLLIDQPFFTLRDEAAVNDQLRNADESARERLRYRSEITDLVYINKCLRDHLTKDFLGVAFVEGGILAVKVKGERTGSVWLCPLDDARDQDGLSVQERVERLLLPCGDDFDAFLLRLAGNPPELDTVANLMVDGGFAHAVPVEA